MLANIKAAIVDLDGTMLDTVADIHCALDRMLQDLGLEAIGIDTVRDAIGKGSEALVRGIPALRLSPPLVEARFEEAFASYLRRYAQINGDFATLYPEVEAGLAALAARGIRLACVTNKPFALANALLDKKGLLRYFEVVYGGDSLPKKKPDPLPFLRVCEEFALAPHEVVAIGDSSNDAQAARAAGCRSLIVPYGYNHGQPVQAIDADGIVETLLDAARFCT